MFANIASVLKNIGKSLWNIEQNCQWLIGNVVNALQIIGKR